MSPHGKRAGGQAQGQPRPPAGTLRAPDRRGCARRPRCPELRPRALPTGRRQPRARPPPPPPHSASLAPTGSGRGAPAFPPTCDPPSLPTAALHNRVATPAPAASRGPAPTAAPPGDPERVGRPRARRGLGGAVCGPRGRARGAVRARRPERGARSLPARPEPLPCAAGETPGTATQTAPRAHRSPGRRTAGQRGRQPGNLYGAAGCTGWQRKKKAQVKKKFFCGFVVLFFSFISYERRCLGKERGRGGGWRGLRAPGPSGPPAGAAARRLPGEVRAR